MLSANSAFVLKTGSGDGSQHFEKLPTNSSMIGTDENGNPIDRTYDMYKVKVNSSDATANYLDAKIADATDVQFTPTDDNSKIDSIVYQLTGIGARLVAKDTGSFQWQGATYGSTLGGRGICSGRVYLSGIDTQVWACNDGVGAIYKTLDDWKTITLDNSWMTFMGGDPTSYHVQPPCIKFVYSTHLSSYIWVITHWPGYGPYYYSYALHTPSNYNSDGTLKSTAWVTVECPQVMADIGTGPDNVALFVGNHDKVYRTTDWNTWTLVYTAPSSHVIGGIDTDGYGNWVIVERDYGVVHISQDNGLTWTTPSIFVRDTEEGDYAPASNLGTAGAVVAGNGIWLVASGSAYNYSTDGIYWTRYVTSLGSFYGMGFDGVKFFATNPMVAQDTKIWQLLVSEIPAHRHLVAEQGITVDKAAYLPFLPSATSLATDAMGKVVAGTAVTEADLGEPDYDDYVLGKPSGVFKWMPRDGLTGVVESTLPDLTVNGGAGTVTVAAMKIQAYPGSEFFGNPLRYQTVETTLSIPDGGNAYYIAFKDDMGPTIYLTDDKSSLNLSNRIPLYLVSRIGTSIHSIGFDTQGVGLPQKAEKALLNTTPYRRSTDGGLALSEDGSRHILLTAATVYAGTTPVDVLAYNSNTSNHLLTHAYHTAGVWTYSTVSAGNGQYNNSQYDNGTDLVSLGTNKYKVVWVFRSIGDDKEIFYVDSTSEYNSSDAAQAAQVPAIPPVMHWHCMLVGRIIVQNGASSGIVQSAFDTVFSASAISNHNNLSGLQGGTSGEYYHATAAEYAKLQQLQVIYDAVVSTSAELQAALESATVGSIYTRLTSAGANIVLGSGTADQTITLGASKNIYGQPFTVGSSTSYVTTLALGSYSLRCRNDRVDVGGKLTFTGTGTAYIKKLSPSGSSNLVVGVSGKLLVENLRTPTAVSNVTINMWDMPLRSGSAVAIADNQYLKYTASTGEWTPVTITGPTDSPLLKAVDTMPVAAASGGVSIVRNSASTYRGHFTQMATNGDIKLDTNSKVQFFCTQAPGSTPNYMIVIYESTSDTSVALTLVAYTTLAAFPNAIQWNSATLANIASGVTGLSASKRYFIGIIWASNNDANLLGVAGSGYAGASPKTLCPAFDIDNINLASGNVPPSSFSAVGSEQTQRHHFRIYNP